MHLMPGVAPTADGECARHGTLRRLMTRTQDFLSMVESRVMLVSVRVVLVSTYELGRQPFGVASAAAYLNEAGAGVTCLDLAVERMDDAPIAAADVVAFYVPMHTATRLAAAAVPAVISLNRSVHLCFFGVYAPANAAYLQQLGAGTILGGEFEEGLVALVRRIATEKEHGVRTTGVHHVEVSHRRQDFRVPDRGGLPSLERYARLILPGGNDRIAGSTEASRGCKHKCRHCPVVPVYGGRFRIVPRAVVLEHIRRQVAAGARHITFGDPDFLNGPGHAVALVRALHDEFPDLTYDVTVKIEHLLRHERDLPTLRDTGCVLVTSAVEAVDDRVLAYFDKRHTRADVIRAVSLLRDTGLALNPTFVTFTPWTSLAGYCDLLALLVQLDLVESVAPIQLAIRLLIPAGSLLLDLQEVRDLVGRFDPAALCYPWVHTDPRVDELYTRVAAAVEAGQEAGLSRRALFQRVWEMAHAATGERAPALPPPGEDEPPRQPPRLSEPWFC